MSGGQIAGVPVVGVGRTNEMAWGLTTARVDTSDLWQEKLNDEKTKYFVDGEWRDLEIIREQIEVKGQGHYIHNVTKTHRGPIMPFNLLKLNSELLLGSVVPSVPRPGEYSFAWHGQFD